MGSEPSDAEVINEVLQGRPERFQILLERYQPYIFSILAKHLPPQNIEEIAHETFVQIYLSLPKFKGESPEEWKGWISKIALRAAYSFWREQYRRREVQLDALTQEQREWVKEVMGRASKDRFDELTRQEEAAQVLDWAMGKLSPKDRMVLELTALEGYSVKEAAEMLGWSTANVKVRSMRAKRKLNRILKEIMEA